MPSVRVLQIMASLGMGGAESRMMDVYRNVEKEAYTLDFLTMQDVVEHYEPELIEKGANVIHVKNPRQVNIFKHISELKKVMKAGKYDAVHAHTSYHCGVALFAAWLAKVPVRIAHARTTGSIQNGIKSRISSFIGRLLIRLFATKRVAISQRAGEYLFKKMSFDVVPNAICVDKYLETQKCEKGTIKQSLGLSENDFVIGQIGRFDEFKNQTFTLQWFANYRKTHADARLVFVGDGVMREEMEILAQALGLQNEVVFTGVRSDVPKLIHAFDVLFFPSLFEGLGGVVLEAQAAGIPTVESYNIPQEADLGLGMVYRCDLTDDFCVWNEAVDRCRTFVAPDTQTVRNAFDQTGYSIDAVTQTYCELYKGKKEKV